MNDFFQPQMFCGFSLIFLDWKISWEMCPFLLVWNKFFAHARMDSTIKLNILNQQKDEGTVGIDGELGT